MANTIKLSKPFNICGKDVTELNFDFDKITGADLTAAEREVRAMGDQTPSVFLSMQFQAAVAAKMLGVPVDDLLAMPASDFKKVVLPVTNFLLDPA